MTGNHIEINDLERLAGISESDPAELPGDLRGAKEHLRHCAECAEMALAFETLRLTRRLPAQQNPGPCPSDGHWFTYAAGIATESQAAGLLSHAQECTPCAEKLKAAVQDLADPDLADPPLADQESLKLLQSSTQAWQKNLAKRMFAEAGASKAAEKSSRQWWKIGNWSPALLVATAVLVVAAVALTGTWMYRQGSEDALLASAYTQRRVTELHLPGGQPVAVYSPTLGQSEADDVLPLLKLRQRARQHLDQNSNDAYWQQVVGRIALAEGKGEMAQQKLDLAFALNPALPGINFDRAAAHFEMGAAGQKPDEFAAAADLFGQVIEKPADKQLKSAAYYNRAICYQRLAVYDKAVSDLESALQSEADPAWRSLIQSLVNKLKPMVRNGEGRGSADLDTSPAGFLQVLKDDARRAEANYEPYLDQASRQWIVQHDERTEAALGRLAAMGLQHHDAWLRDLLDHDRPGSSPALERLAEALRANLAGDADRALSALTAAAALFQKSHNTAGLLRTHAEMLYTYQRMGRSEECVKIAAHSPQQQWRPYPWLNSYQLLESSICRAARGDSEQYQRDILHCIELSRAAQLPIQVLRERGMLVEALDSAGQPEEALRSVTLGLEECAGGALCSPMRSYQFQQSLLVLLQGKKLPWAAADAAEAAAHTSELVSNLQIRSYAQEVLGTAETAAGRTGLANDAFSRASALLNTMPDGHTAALYQADWKSDRSLLLERQGQLPLALQDMRDASSQIAATDNFDVRQRYYTRLAGLLLDADKPADALQTSLAAVTDAEHALSAARSETEKLSWEKTYGRGYRLLVESLVAMGKTRESLQAWEWYHSAPYRAPTSSFDTARPAYASIRLPAGSSLRSGGLTLIVAQLENTFVAWSISRYAESPVPINPVRMIKLSTPPQRVSEATGTFAELCSDRDSSPHDIEVLGAKLYQYLLSPFDDQIQQTALLALEVDASLQRIPFAALSRPDHRYLNDTHALIFLPAWWTLHPPAPETIPADASALLVEGSASLPNSETAAASTIPAEYLESAEVAAHFSHSFLLRRQEASVAQILKRLPGVDVFHYNGHTFTVSEQTGLLLHPNELFTASNLRGVSLTRCKLAVLAACSSAGGSGDGMEDTSNLAHALLTAGAANVVATLWDVDASASRTMMLQMYDSLSHSMPITAAIRAAQLKLRSNPAARHPYFWSSVQVFTQ
jgi:CHAT domain-containing protein/tetratricopeptide (TPR) repeat protein